MHLPDDLNDILSDSMSAASNGSMSRRALYERVLAQTIGVIRSRRRMKRLGVAAALTGCYLAGLLTMSVFRAPALGSAGDFATRVDANVDNGLEPMSARPLVRPEDDGVILASASTHTAAAKLTPYDRLRRAGD